MLLRPINRLLVSLFVVFHFSAVTVWLFWPYTQQYNQNSDTHVVLAEAERSVFNQLEKVDGSQLLKTFQWYIDGFGLHQYWDFFALDTPLVYRILTICSKLSEQPVSNRIGCRHPLYQSNTADTDQSFPSFNSHRSRDFRLVENLVRLRRPDFYEQLLKFWSNRRNSGNRLEGDHTYAVISEIRLVHGMSSTILQGQQDEIVWMVDN